MSETKWIEDTMMLGGEEVLVRNGQLPVTTLRFYEDNPRIYSIVRRNGYTPSQEEIHRRLSEMDRVRQLIRSIRANGGLTDPLLVRDGDYVVLEGNSRLAAYRVLYDRDPITWGMVKVRLLPENISEKLVFALLGEYHIIGRQDWRPYEQAGYLYRRSVDHNISSEEMSEQIGLAKGEINRLIGVYGFMVKHG